MNRNKQKAEKGIERKAGVMVTWKPSEESAEREQ